MIVGYRDWWFEVNVRDEYDKDPIMNEVSWPTSAFTSVPERANDMKGKRSFSKMKENRGSRIYALTQTQ